MLPLLYLQTFLIILSNVGFVLPLAILAWNGIMLPLQWNCLCSCPNCKIITLFHLKDTSIIIIAVN